MRKKIIIGLCFGVVAGVIDVSPMLVMRLPWDADLSAFLMWLVVGFFVAVSNLKMRGIFKGILIAFLVMLPIAIIIGSRNIFDLVPVVTMTLLLGCFVGYFVGRFGES